MLKLIKVINKLLILVYLLIPLLKYLIKTLKKTDKILLFEYIHSRLIEWYDNSKNDLSILKTLKLLYFVTNINPEDKLLDIFDNYHAMPYGPVEQDVYNSMLNKSEFRLNFYSFDRYTSSLKKTLDFTNLDIEYKNKADRSVEILKQLNSNLINYTASELVELSHLRSSWIYFFKKAKSSNKLSHPMQKEFIEQEEKIIRFY